MPLSSPSRSLRPPPGGQQPAGAIMPDNRCCFCLTLRKGTILIGVVNTLINLGGFLWYVLSPMNRSSWMDSSSPVSHMDISYFVVLVLQLICNTILIMGAIRKLPSYTLPWLSINVGLIAILLVRVAILLVLPTVWTSSSRRASAPQQVLITLLLFVGSIQTPLTQDEYVSTLTTLGVLGAALIFSWLVVFQFRKNLLDERRVLETLVPSAPSPEVQMPENFQRNPSPPPSYDEASKVAMAVAASLSDSRQPSAGYTDAGAKDLSGVKIALNEAPPEYHAAVAMSPIPLVLAAQTPIQQRKATPPPPPPQPGLVAASCNPGEVSFYVEIDSKSAGNHWTSQAINN